MADSPEAGFWKGLGREGRFVVGLITIALIILTALLLPEQLVAFDSSEPATTDQINAARRTLVQFLGGFAVLAGLWLTARRIRASERRAEALEDQIRITEQGQVTERFTRAIEQLGSDTLQIRLGGIYSLERIAKDSTDDYRTVMEVLCAFVREKLPQERSDHEEGEGEDEESDADAGREQKQLETDVQATLTVISRLNELRNPVSELEEIIRARQDNGEESDDKRVVINLAGIDARKVDLSELNLSFATLHQANLNAAVLPLHLEGADLQAARLKGANLFNARLKGADLCTAHLEGADLRTAHLEGADLRTAHLEGANLRGAHFEGANLRGVHLEGADLLMAHLEGADLLMAHLEGAVLFMAFLEGADLRGAYLEGAFLAASHLEGANLYQAYLEGASLADSHLKGANLEGADLDAANLEGAVLQDADLRRVRNIKVDQLVTCRTLYRAKLAPDLEAAVREQCPELLEPPAE